MLNPNSIMLLAAVVVLVAGAMLLHARLRPRGALFATLSTEKNLLTKQRVDIALAGASAFAAMVFRSVITFLVTQKGEKQVQLIAISDLTVDVNPLDGTLKVYAIYLKKQATATAAFFKIFDDATDDSTAGDARVAMGLLTTSEEQIALFPNGLALTDGLVIGAYTAYIGANNVTPTTTGDGPNGFLLVGA